VNHLSGAKLNGRLLALRANFRQSCLDLPGKTFYLITNIFNYDRKIFIDNWPWIFTNLSLRNHISGLPISKAAHLNHSVSVV
jgi:hypothetical protein